MNFLALWRQWASQLKIETYALYLAYKDPRVPWYARLSAVVVVGYAFSPIDLIPDFIPVLGHLDDLVLIPLGIILVLKMIPQDVMIECRQQARITMKQNRPMNRTAAVIIVSIWLILATILILYVVRILRS
jgi:uncharacterized membrane protein YkvA (DUF1232 family)